MAEDAQAAKSGTNEDTSRTDTEKASLESLNLTMDKRYDLVLAVVVLLIGVFLLIESLDIRPGMVRDPITSRGLGVYSGILIIIFASVQVVVRLVTWSALPGNFVPSEAEGASDEPQYPASAARSLSIALTGMLWVWLLKPLGCVIATPVFLFIVIWIMGVRSRAKLIAFPIVFGLAMWTMFSQILKIIMPMGPLEPLARSLGLMP